MSNKRPLPTKSKTRREVEAAELLLQANRRDAETAEAGDVEEAEEREVSQAIEVLRKYGWGAKEMPPKHGANGTLKSFLLEKIYNE